jgi:hypothetical protein
MRNRSGKAHVNFLTLVKSVSEQQQSSRHQNASLENGGGTGQAVDCAPSNRSFLWLEGAPRRGKLRAGGGIAASRGPIVRPRLKSRRYGVAVHDRGLFASNARTLRRVALSRNDRNGAET